MALNVRKNCLNSPQPPLLTICLVVATVVCCCISSSVMAHLHKTSVCSHCPPQSSSGHSSNPTDGCVYRLANAEASLSQAIIRPASIVFTSTTFFTNTQRNRFCRLPFKHLPAVVCHWPQVSPHYLRTFSLRINFLINISLQPFVRVMREGFVFTPIIREKNLNSINLFLTFP